MKNRVLYVIPHIILLLLALVNMYCMIKGPDYFEYIYMIDDVLRRGRGITTITIAILCDMVLFLIDVGVFSTFVVDTIKQLIKKEPLLYLNEVKFWGIMTAIAIITFLIYFRYYIMHL